MQTDTLFCRNYMNSDVETSILPTNDFMYKGAQGLHGGPAYSRDSSSLFIRSLMCPCVVMYMTLGCYQPEHTSAWVSGTVCSCCS